MTASACVNLAPHFFSDYQEQSFIEYHDLSASIFLFRSGVRGLRLTNGVGEIVTLPFQGQQIWSAQLGGRELTMQSMFPEPRRTQKFDENYGAFLIHCGAMAMGDPTPQDNHSLHGELPNAFYQKAYLILGEDEKGAYIGLGGQYQHTVAFACNYVAEPLVRLYAGSSSLSISMTITNLKNSEMEFMYLTHVNFKPVDDGRLVYSAIPTPEHVRVRKALPGLQASEGYIDFIEDLARNPEKHHRLSPGLMFDPEVVFFIDYLADEEGWAHTLQVHPDGSSDYLRYRPHQLEKCVRWISRTFDQDALGMALPATAESEGYLTEKTKGNVKVLAPKDKFFCELEIGVLNPGETKNMEKKISQLTSAPGRVG